MELINTQPAFSAEIELGRNLVRTYFRGHVTGAEMAAVLPSVDRLLGQLKPGFTVLADLSAVDSLDLDSGPSFSKLMDLCRIHGVGKIVRIIPSPAQDFGINILSIIHYRGKVPIATYKTLAEAEHELAG